MVSIGWMVVCFFTMFVGLGMAEITSAIPTSGGEFSRVFCDSVLVADRVGSSRGIKCMEVQEC